MCKILKKLFHKKPKVEEKPKRDPLQKQLQKERIKRRKALRKNKAERRNYRESTGQWVCPKPRKKKYNKPQDATQSWYYQQLQKEGKVTNND